RLAHDEGTAGERRRVIGVHRLVEFEHQVVGDINHVVDAAHAYRCQPFAQPFRRGADLHAAHDGREEAATTGAIGDRDPEATNGRLVTVTTRCRQVDVDSARNLRQPERNPVRGGELARDALV